MPRPSDPHVEARILEAAQRLVHKGGENALSMRKVAAAAGTNTPAVYRRFRNKNDILRALMHRNQQSVFGVLKDCISLQEIAERALDFALGHPREYQLLTSGVFAKISDQRPNIDFVMQRSAEWHGGSPKDHMRLVLALWSLLHGTAMLLSSNALTPEHAAELRLAYTAAAKSLISQEPQLRKRL